MAKQFKIMRRVFEKYFDSNGSAILGLQLFDWLKVNMTNVKGIFCTWVSAMILQHSEFILTFL